MGSNSTMTTISSRLPDPLLLKENDWIDSCPLNSQSYGEDSMFTQTAVIRFKSLTFAWIALSGFQSTGIPFFA